MNDGLYTYTYDAEGNVISENAMKSIKVCVLGAVLITCPAISCFSQNITIRVINGANGKPLVRQQVSASFLDSSDGHNVNAANTIALITDDMGNTSLRLPSPRPAYLSVQVKLSAETWHCGCLKTLITGEVLNKGYIEALAMGGQDKEQPRAGEILFLARPYTFWKRLLHPLVRE